ncbi:MAG TPA: nicotinate-nucleotide--dimethylbenzimidazole phosphoribosyltransferase, partial [Candidatus Dormibacteraeota bacterium]|nr:nicotinate-nucleotide--dimethylbenzimidazole phosphoribosyltransferase [Candidatus Dormibacteraeota bacterium]
MENPLKDLAQKPLGGGIGTAMRSGDAPRDWLGFANAKLNSLTKPLGSLGRLEEIAGKIVCIREQECPSHADKVVYVFAGDHGVTEEGVSAYPKSVTHQMVRNFLANGAAINVFSRCAGAEVVVVDVGVDAELDSHSGLLDRKIRRGTHNMAKEPAMTDSELGAALEVGRALAQQARSHDLVAVGEMGIGNTTAAAAIAAALLGKLVEEVTGTGTGVSPEGLIHKRLVIRKALEVNALNQNCSPLEILQKVGGLEIAAMTGFLLEAQQQRVPAIIDGFISTAAAALACAIEPQVKDVLFAGH